MVWLPACLEPIKHDVVQVRERMRVGGRLFELRGVGVARLPAGVRNGACASERGVLFQRGNGPLFVGDVAISGGSMAEEMAAAWSDLVCPEPRVGLCTEPSTQIEYPVLKRGEVPRVTTSELEGGHT